MTTRSSVVAQEQFFLTGYNVLTTIGEGTFSVVKHATHKLTNEHVAIKIVNKTGLHYDDIAQLSTEVRILKLIRHPFIIRLYEYFESPNKFFLVLEFGDCSLLDFIQKFFKNIPMRESSARKFLLQMVSAVSYIHKFLIVHQDLKPENILLCNDYRIAKVADFGLSKILGECQPLNSVGSLCYIAPEVLFGETTTTEETDIWGLGMILYVMVTSSNPFEHLNKNEMTINIIDCNYDLPDHLSEDCKMLISKMLTRDPADRIPLKSLSTHKWLIGKLGTKFVDIDSYIVTINQTVHNCVIKEMTDKKIASKMRILNSLIHNSFDHVSSCYYLLAESLVKKAMNLDFPICLVFNPEVFNCEIEREKHSVTDENTYKKISDSMNDISKLIDKETFMKSPIKTRKNSKLAHNLSFSPKSTSNLIRSVNETRRYSMQGPLCNPGSSGIDLSKSQNDLNDSTAGNFPTRIRSQFDLIDLLQIPEDDQSQNSHLNQKTKLSSSSFCLTSSKNYKDKSIENNKTDILNYQKRPKINFNPINS